MVPFSYRTIDGGLVIVDACPADIGPTRVWPVGAPGGRLILVAQRHEEARRFDARTGQAVGDPGRPWPGDFDFACPTRPTGRRTSSATSSPGSDHLRLPSPLVSQRTHTPSAELRQGEIHRRRAPHPTS